jgi:tetratricopeptide (TPR) repeat protein
VCSSDLPDNPVFFLIAAHPHSLWRRKLTRDAVIADLKEVKPDFVWSFVESAREYSYPLVSATKDDLEHALADATKAVEIAPAEPEPQLVRGMVLLDSGQYDAAAVAFERALNLAGKIGENKNCALVAALMALEAQYGLGYVRYMQGNVDKAVQCLQSGLQRPGQEKGIYFRHFGACSLLIRCLHAKGDFEGGAKLRADIVAALKDRSFVDKGRVIGRRAMLCIDAWWDGESCVLVYENPEPDLEREEERIFSFELRKSKEKKRTEMFEDGVDPERMMTVDYHNFGSPELSAYFFEETFSGKSRMTHKTYGQYKEKPAYKDLAGRAKDGLLGKEEEEEDKGDEEAE